MANKQRSRRLRPKDEAEHYIRAGNDKTGFQEHYINVHKGRRVFAQDAVRKGDRTLGKLVNDNWRKPNCKIKIIEVRGRSHLCFFAIQNILPGEEIEYNYGDVNWPWIGQFGEEAYGGETYRTATDEAGCDTDSPTSGAAAQFYIVNLINQMCHVTRLCSQHKKDQVVACYRPKNEVGIFLE